MADEGLSFRDRTAIAIFVELVCSCRQADQELVEEKQLERYDAYNARVAYDAAATLVAERQRRKVEHVE